MKCKTILILLLLCVGVMSQSYHADQKTTAIHTPYRWIWADSATRVAQATIKRDTTKLGFQLDDYSVWYLKDTLPTWYLVGTYKSDSLRVAGNVAIGPGASLSEVSLEIRSAAASSYGVDWVNSDADMLAVISDDTYISIVSGDGGTWGGGLAIREILAADGSYNNSWGITRETTGAGSGDGSLKITFGASTILASNDVKLKVDTTGDLTVAGDLFVDGMNMLDTASFPCTTSGLVTEDVSRVKYSKVGNLVTMTIPELIGTSDANTFVIKCGNFLDDYGLRPTTDTFITQAVVANDGAITWGSAVVYVSATSDEIVLWVEGSDIGWSSSGSKAVYSCSITFAQ